MKKFIVSVGEAILRNPATKEIIAMGTTAVDTSFTLTANKTDVRGGPGNSILFSYVSERTFDVSITQASFNKEVLALNAGTLIQTGLIEYLHTDCIELDATGKGTLSKTPIGNVTVIGEDDVKATVTPTGDDITVAERANQTVHATYMTSGEAETVTISATAPPSLVELIYTTEIRDDKNQVVEIMQIHVPRLQLSGNYTMTLSASGAATEAIEGTALSSREGGCGAGGYYARVAWVPVDGAGFGASFSQIAAVPSDWSFKTGASPLTKQIEVLGIPGDGIRANINITSDCTFAKDTGGSASITVSAGGLVTMTAGATAGDEATVVATHTATGLTDRCLFTVTA